MPRRRKLKMTISETMSPVVIQQMDIGDCGFLGMEIMNTLVTGVTGSINSNLVEELLKAGEDVRVLDEMHTEKGPHLQPN